jgi:hypothetical protein
MGVSATLHSGLTKARRYDGEDGAAWRPPFGNSPWNFGWCLPVAPMNRNGQAGKESPLHEPRAASFDLLPDMDDR